MAFIGFQGSAYWGFSEGESSVDDDATEAPDSDEADKMGGWFSKDAELGEPRGGVYWKEGFTPCAIPS